MTWINVNERMPKEEETIDGFVPVFDSTGRLARALFINNPGEEPWLMTDSGEAALFWMPVTRPV